MSPLVEGLKTQLGQLPSDDRAELAHFLLSTLGAEDHDAESVWDRLASQRVAKIRAGEAKGRDASGFLGELRERYP